MGLPGLGDRRFLQSNWSRRFDPTSLRHPLGKERWKRPSPSKTPRHAQARRQLQGDGKCLGVTFLKSIPLPIYPPAV